MIETFRNLSKEGAVVRNHGGVMAELGCLFSAERPGSRRDVGANLGPSFFCRRALQSKLRNDLALNLWYMKTV